MVIFSLNSKNEQFSFAVFIVWRDLDKKQRSQQKFTTMTSAYSSRYRSKLFNFVHQQTRRLGEQVERAVRHLQVAANFSLGAILYPIYLLIKKITEPVDKQLHTAQPNRRLELQEQSINSQPQTPPSTDTPIQKVLQAVEKLEILGKGEQSFTPKRKNTPPVPPSTPPAWTFPTPVLFISSFFAYFASSLPAGCSASTWFTLSPTHSSNQPNLTPSPITETSPKTLNTSNSVKILPHHNSLLRGIASQLGNRSLVLVSAENQILDILSPQQQEKLQMQMTVEIANYWRWWRLTSVKDETQLLPEIDRLLTKLTGSGIGSELPALPQKAVTLLDSAVASLESNAIAPISRASQEVIQVVQAQLNVLLYGKEQGITSTNQAVSTEEQNQTHSIQALIWEAVNYFFGDRKGKQLEETTPASQESRKFPNQSQRKQMFVGSSGDVVKSEIPSDGITTSWLTSSDLFGEFDKESKPVSQRSKGGGSKVEAKPDWIETKAKTIGYVKHPLEVILAWLDSAMLFVEKIVVNIFQFLEQMWRGK
jgi:hypothetical protein